MKALKRAVFVTFMSVSLVLIAMGGYNSSILDKSVLFKDDFGIKLAKRLDEINGEVTVGRMAASLPKWSAASTALIKKQAQDIISPKLQKKMKVVKKKKNNTEKVVENKSIPAPVINDDLELSLSGGFYNKKALTDKSKFSGTAIVQDGIIEEVSVSLPGGSSFSINTNDRMVGNVFQYEDTATRERRSGLFYKVKEGVYMLTLTDDSQYPGLRLEFRTNGNTQQLAQEDNWNVEQNSEQQESVEHAENNEVEKDYYQQEAVDQAQDTVDPDTSNQPAYGFNFNV